MTSRAAALALLAVLAAGAAVAGNLVTTPGRNTKGQPGIGRCVKQTKQDEKTCVRTEVERCRQHFETELVECFHTHGACAKKCIDAERGCRTSPKTSADGCRLACASDLRVEIDACKHKADLHDCESPARVKALKCKQKCTAEAAPAVEDCLRDFDDCLGICLPAAEQ